MFLLDTLRKIDLLSTCIYKVYTSPLFHTAKMLDRNYTRHGRLKMRGFISSIKRLDFGNIFFIKHVVDLVPGEYN